MLSAFFAKIIALFLSVAISASITFGFQKPSTTSEPEAYYNSNIKNVIYLIGDGMGFNHLEKTKAERKTSLVMDSFGIKGSSMTRSMNKKVTDSAAGGTALSCGIRTDNSAVGVYHLDKKPRWSHPVSITEFCIERGMLTGIVTTDETTGATPSAFSAHSSDRYNTDDLTEDQLNSQINLIWGNANGVVTKEAAVEKGFTYITTYSEMMALPEGSRSYAQFTNSLWKLTQADKKNPNLEQMAMKAVDILDDTDEGFFLMIEGAHIDKHSHNNDSESATEAVLEFDRTVKAMLDYARKDGETLVVVTADHETGGLTLENGSYIFTSEDHSAADVPVLVYGSDKLIGQGEKINNYEIPIRIVYTLGGSKNQFPSSIIV